LRARPLRRLLRPYAGVLGAPGVRLLATAAFVGTLPIGIEYLGIVLFVLAETGSYGLAGAAAAIFAGSSGLAQPLLGRWVERSGDRLFVPLAAVHATGIVMLVVVGAVGAPNWLLVVVAAVPGATSPPILQALRALWPTIAAGDVAFVSAAYALDAVSVEMIFVVGPLLAGVVALAASPALALLLAATLALVGSVGFVVVRRIRGWSLHATTARASGLGALKSPGMRTVAAVILLSSFPIGLLEVALPALADEMADAGFAGLLLALWGIGSMVGGLLYGSWAAGSTPDRAWPRLLSLQALSFLLLAAGPSLVAIMVLLGPSGLFAAPILIVGNRLTSQLVPVGARVEAFSWTRAALILGVASGSGAAGLVVEYGGWRAAFVVAALVSLVGGLVASARHNHVAAQPAESPPRS
jgi:MFS family permease